MWTRPTRMTRRCHRGSISNEVGASSRLRADGYKHTPVLVNVYLSSAEGGGGGDRVEERGDPGPQGLSERISAGEGDPEAEPDPAGDPEAERAERQGEGAQQEGGEHTHTHTHTHSTHHSQNNTTMSCSLWSGSVFEVRAAV